jgi:hypothetical protein
MAMSWPYATSASPSSSITMLMMTTRLTPLALTTNYTEVSDFVGNTTDIYDEEEEYTPYSERPETYIVPIVFLLILLIGLTGNGVLALTILRHTNMRNVPNTYVLSLALGDLLACNIYICKCRDFSLSMRNPVTRTKLLIYPSQITINFSELIYNIPMQTFHAIVNMHYKISVFYLSKCLI